MLITTMVGSAALTKMASAAAIIFLPDVAVKAIFRLDRKIQTKKVRRVEG